MDIDSESGRSSNPYDAPEEHTVATGSHRRPSVLAWIGILFLALVAAATAAAVTCVGVVMTANSLTQPGEEYAMLAIGMDLSIFAAVIAGLSVVGALLKRISEKPPSASATLPVPASQLSSDQEKQP
ncbi:MAG: hypothetical protein R3C49_05230 [Planctomycetaceae bacterium]